MNSDIIYKIAFGMLKGINVASAAEILVRVGDEENFFTSSRKALASLIGSDSKILDDTYRANVLEKAKSELEFCLNNRIKVFYFSDNGYPRRMLECTDSPVVMYGIGDCDLNSIKIISIVGTRHATMYGLRFVEEIIENFSQTLDNVIIVSGLAYGIDVKAHKESLSHGLPTVAVLAHGLDTIYPAVHRNIGVEIVKSGGMLLTDYPHRTTMHRSNFIARNRIVAGLADCTLVVESAIKGGAIITAGIAGNYSRDVFALPGRTSDLYSQGCNRLIHENRAALVQSADDIIDSMCWERKTVVKTKSLFSEYSDEERPIVEFLRKEGEGHINRMSVELNMPMHKLMAVLLDMEFKGMIINYPGGLYRLG